MPQRTAVRPVYFGAFNFIVRSLLRLGVPVGPMTLLTVRGRKSGLARTTPVGLMQHEGHYYVLGTFGDSNWCRNLRAAREASVGRGRRKEEVSVSEVQDPKEKARLLKDILAPLLSSRMGSSMLKMGYELSKDSTMEDYEREARRHPGFEVQFRSMRG